MARHGQADEAFHAYRGTAASTVVNYGLHLLFMGAFRWGELGTGWAVVWGQWVGTILLGARRGAVGPFNWPDMLKLTSGHEMAATLKAMVALSVTYMVQVSMRLFAHARLLVIALHCCAAAVSHAPDCKHVPQCMKPAQWTVSAGSAPTDRNIGGRRCWSSSVGSTHGRTAAL